MQQRQKPIIDPNYKIQIQRKDLTDHFYDTGIYKTHWDYSQYKSKAFSVALAIVEPIKGQTALPTKRHLLFSEEPTN
jgi:hypothetical protein